MPSPPRRADGAGCASTHGGQRTSRPGYGARSKLAHELVSRGDWARAFAMLDELHRERPDDAEVLTLRGIVFRERGLFADAEADLKAALKLAPDSAEAHAALGILYDVQMRPEAEARAPRGGQAGAQEPRLPEQPRASRCSCASTSRRRSPPTNRRRGWRRCRGACARTSGFACAALGDLRRAAREFQMGGTEAEAKNNLGFAYERRGDMANAYDLYVEAVRLDPKAERARSNLVHAALVLGRPVPPEAAPPVAPSERHRRGSSSRSVRRTQTGGAPVKKTRLWLLSLAFVVSAMSRRAAAAARTSAASTPSAYTAWFTAQHVKTKAANPEEARRIIESLDAQEAGSVSKNYRKGVSRAARTGGSRLLTIGRGRGRPAARATCRRLRSPSESRAARGGETAS